MKTTCDYMLTSLIPGPWSSVAEGHTGQVQTHCCTARAIGVIICVLSKVSRGGATLSSFLGRRDSVGSRLSRQVTQTKAEGPRVSPLRRVTFLGSTEEKEAISDLVRLPKDTLGHPSAFPR